MQATKPVEVVVFELRSILCCCCCSCKVLFRSQLACSAGGSNTFLASSSLRLRLLLFIKAGGEWVEGAPVSLPLTSITDAMDAVRDLVRDLLGGAMGSIWAVSSNAAESSSAGCAIPPPPTGGTGRGSRSCGG